MDTHRSTRPRFSGIEQRRLLQALAEVHNVRLYRRLQAVAAVAEGESLAEVARRARVARSTVYRWVERYLDVRRPSALADGTRGGRPSVATALTKRKLIALLKTDPRRFGYDANTWTVPLLTAHLQSEGIQISARTLRRRIRAARFRWKRPRYVYRERAAHVGAKKGGSSAA
jgi:transposase